MKRAGLILVFLSLAVAVTASAISVPDGVTRGASMEGITEYELANGLRVLLLPDAAKPTITVNIVYLAGSRHENYGETGMAHLLEHLVSYGSSRHPDAKAEQAARGARRNASTSFDRTNYYETFPATSDNLAWALDLEADRMRTAPISTEILASQMSVVRNEYEAGENNVERVLYQRLWSTAHLWHNYGKPTIGARSDIEHVPIERLQAYYDSYYHPNNAVLVVAGQFDEAEALRLVAEKFLPVPRSPKPIPATYTEEPVQDGERTVTLRRVGDAHHLLAGFRTPPATHPDNAALVLLARVLTSAPSGRLHRALVETGRAASVSGGVTPLREGGMFSVQATVRREGAPDETRAALLATLDALVSEPITSEEVDRARSQWMRDFTLMITDPERVSSTLTTKIAIGDWRLLFLERDWIRSATVEDVRRAAATYLVLSNRTLATFVPEDQPVRAVPPPALDFAALIREYKGDPDAPVGEAFEPTPENIDARTLRVEVPDGPKLALLAKRTRGATVSGVLRLHFGDLASLHGRATDAQSVREMLLRGTRTRTRQQIEDELSRLQARLGVEGGTDAIELSFGTVREHLPALLALMAEVLREPTFATGEFEQWRQAGLAALESERSDPQAIASRALRQHLAPYPPGDPRSVRSIEVMLEAMGAATPERARAFHAEFLGASHAELALVGDFDPEEVRRLVAGKFASWKTPGRFERIPAPFPTVGSVERWHETPDKANAFYTAGLPVAVGEEHPDYPALALASYLLGGHAKSRFYDRIRGRDGLSYGVAARLVVEARENSGTFTMLAITNPVNIQKVDTAFREELARAVADGFEAAEFADAKQGWLQSSHLARAQDSILAGQLCRQAEFGRTMAFRAAIEARVAALTSAEVVEALRRHVVPERISRFKAGDFKAAGVSP